MTSTASPSSSSTNLGSSITHDCGDGLTDEAKAERMRQETQKAFDNIQMLIDQMRSYQ